MPRKSDKVSKGLCGTRFRLKEEISKKRMCDLVARDEAGAAVTKPLSDMVVVGSL